MTPDGAIHAGVLPCPQMALRPILLLFLAGLTACGRPQDDLVRGNTPPQAAMRAPVIAPLGTGPECTSDLTCQVPTGCSVDPEYPPNGACDLVPCHCRVRFDASRSIDYDADPLTYVFQFGDGSEALHSADPVVYHAFIVEAVYEVAVRAIDIHGEESMAAQDVSVRNNFPDPPDFCLGDADCTGGNECDGGVCFSTGGTVE